MADTSQRPELIKRVQKFIPNKDNFNKLRETNPKSEMGRAYKYFVINRTAYSGIMNKPNWGYDNKKSVPPKRWGERIQNAGQKLNFAKITNYHFREIILQKSKHPVFLFVDPPYMKADQKRAYFHSFQLNDHIELEKLLNKTPYSFCLTYDNCDEARDLYSWANIHDFSWRYHTANSKVATRKMGKELIITNF